MSASHASQSSTETYDYDMMRRAMIDSQLRPNAVEQKWILQAMGETPREDYVPMQYRDIAYMDRSVPMGTQRYLAPALTSALMLQKADIQTNDTILFIGSGSGYNAMIAAKRARHIIAVESDIENQALADNITFIQGPLSQGAAEHGPYSLIVIEGAIEQVPQNIIDQLAIGGRLLCGLMEGEVSHLCIGYKHSNTIALVPFMECEIEKFMSKYGFDKEKEFSF